MLRCSEKLEWLGHLVYAHLQLPFMCFLKKKIKPCFNTIGPLSSVTECVCHKLVVLMMSEYHIHCPLQTPITL